MKNRIICLVLSLVFVFGLLGANGTYAWFLDYSGAGDDVQSLHNLISGNIGYTLIGDFKDMGTQKIRPEWNLLDDLTLDEKTSYGITDTSDCSMYLQSTSLVDTNVRVKVYYTYIDESYQISNENCYVGAGAPFVAEADSNYWYYDETDDCFYYTSDGTDTPGIISAVTADGQTKSIPLFKSLRYSGENSNIPTSAFAQNNVFIVRLVFQAKQAKHNIGTDAEWGPEWTDLGEITFSTGDTV